MKNTKATKTYTLTFSILLILLISQPSIEIAKAQEPSEKSYNALFIVANGYGDNAVAAVKLAQQLLKAK